MADEGATTGRAGLYIRECALALALMLTLALPLAAQDDRARALVELALADTLAPSAVEQIVQALDDKDETVRLATAVAACHSLALSESHFTFALGTVHTSIRPSLRKRPNQQDWTLTPVAVTKVVQAYLPRDLAPARLARLKAAAVGANNLTRDVASFLLSRDALVSPALAREVDALLFDANLRIMHRIELAAMCFDRLGVGVLPVCDAVRASDGEAAAAVHALMQLVANLPGGAAALGKMAARPAGDAAHLAAATLIENVRASSDARAALKEAFRSETMQPGVRDYISRETEKLKSK